MNQKNIVKVIPCLDVHNGRVVKGIQFENLKDAGDPAELAAFYDREGADEIVLLDISATVEGRHTMLDVVRRTAKRVSKPFIIGGGMGSIEDIERVLDAGADKISLNTAAVRNPDLLAQAAQKFGSQHIIAAIDVLRSGDSTESDQKAQSWKVVVSGGHESTDWDVVEWARRVEKLGAGEILLTSKDRDGTEDGYDNDLNRQVSESVDIGVVASGGAGKLQHFVDAVRLGGVRAVLAASVFHFATFSIRGVKEYLADHGVEVHL
ncbi:MAG: imidazole glycerol phosphate synthase subunit HisF [Peptococcaceae bacterium]|nr:imidazole glycerol phosphate synthase subunit HisF [Peptococcaceae bacterium]